MAVSLEEMAATAAAASADLVVQEVQVDLEALEAVPQEAQDFR